MTVKFRFFQYLILILLAVVLVLSGCKKNVQDISDTSKDDNRQILRVGVSTNAPPLIYQENGQITGLESVLAEKLGNYLNRRIVFVEVPWKKQLDYLKDGKTDIVMSAMTITKKRSFLVDFTIPYMRSGQIMLVRMEDSQRFSTGITSVMNTDYRIGTVRNTTGDFFVSSAINGANETVFSISEQAVESLIRGKIDVFVYDAPMICYYAAQSEADKLVPILAMGTEEYLAWAIRKSDIDLKNQVNAFLKSFKESGELQQEIKRWIPYLYR